MLRERLTSRKSFLGPLAEIRTGWLAGWNSLFDNKNGQSRGYVLHCMTNNDDQMAVARAMNCALISKRFL